MFSLLLHLVCALSLAHAEFKVPALTGPVVDQAGVLNPNTRESLANFLRSLHDKGGAQIQVATVDDLGGLAIEEASIKITDQWKLGKKKEDRGVLLLLAPKEHKVRIEVGYGLEGDLPDAIANRIVQEVMVPRLRDGNYDRAVVNGVLAIARITDPNLAPSARDNRQPPHEEHSGLILILTILTILIVIFGPRRGFFYGGGFGGFGGGGFGGGGFGGGGGWSGGGGGFGGGGASGSW